MAHYTYAKLTIAGDPVGGTHGTTEVSDISVEKGDHVEVLSFDTNWNRHFDPTTGKTTGAMNSSGFNLVLKLGPSTPLFLRGMDNNEIIEGSILFFGTHPETGDDVHEYTIDFTQGRLVSLSHSHGGGQGSVNINILANDLNWTWQEGAIEHAIVWKTR